MQFQLFYRPKNKQKNNAVVFITVFILKMKNYEKDF